MQYGVSRNEQIRIRCEVDAEPSNGLTFRWTLNTSGSETSSEWASFTVNATTSIATYRPENSLDYGTLACVAQNSIGSQSEPCIYNVVPAGKIKVEFVLKRSLVRFHQLKVQYKTSAHLVYSDLNLTLFQ